MPGPPSDDAHGGPAHSWHRRVWVLSAAGAFAGHLACVVGSLGRRREPWLWFVVVRPDGTKESAFEDYGSFWEERPGGRSEGWCTADELDAGYLDHHGQETSRRSRVLGRRWATVVPGAACRYDATLLGPGSARKRWAELGLVDGDF
ncbi:hypothetical protein [Brachybacterium sp. AOP25-B2-12]|uniref:hypothetical protein n=1 Tax=Brachybacterium sp. AOP25-B2-12 TaxID=3457710 RepID=UPI004033983F